MTRRTSSGPMAVLSVSSSATLGLTPLRLLRLLLLLLWQRRQTHRREGSIEGGKNVIGDVEGTVVSERGIHIDGQVGAARGHDLINRRVQLGIDLAKDIRLDRLHILLRTREF